MFKKPLLTKTVQWNYGGHGDDDAQNKASFFFGSFYSLSLGLSRDDQRSSIFSVKAKTYLCVKEPIVGDPYIDQVIYGFLPPKKMVGIANVTVVACRPSDDFFGSLPHYPDYNGNLFDECNGIFNHRGIPSLSLDPLLKEDPEANGGPLLHIGRVHIHPSFSGLDLGLRMVHEVLMFLDDAAKLNNTKRGFNNLSRWTLALLDPSPLIEHRLLLFPLPAKRSSLHREENEAGQHLAKEKVSRQFSRLGFIQSKRLMDKSCDTWLLTRKMYFEKRPSSREDQAFSLLSTEEIASAYWFTKDEVQQRLSSILRPKAKELATQTEADIGLRNIFRKEMREMNRITDIGQKELVPYQILDRSKKMRELILEDFSRPRGDLPRLEENIRAMEEELNSLTEQKIAAGRARKKTMKEALLRALEQGGSERSLVLHHFLAEDFHPRRMPVLEVLCEVGGILNHQDEFGNTALHVASSLCEYEAIQYLLSAGADHTICNLNDEVPMTCFQSARQSLRNKACFNGKKNSRPPGDDEMSRILGVMQAFMVADGLDYKNLLVEGWLSPRMMKMLGTTAQLEHTKVEAGYRAIRPGRTSYSMLDLKFAYPRINYMFAKAWPTLSAPRSEESVRTLVGGYVRVWGAINSLLNVERIVPTVQRIVDFIDCNLQQQQGNEPPLLNFFRQGGRIVYALDALLYISEDVWNGKVNGWGKSLVQSEIDALPETPMDDMYDLAWFMCIDHGGGAWPSTELRGPVQQ